MSHKAIILAVAFAATIPAANWMIGNVGDCSSGPCVIPVGFGMYAPSGVMMIGIALVLRDLIYEQSGRNAALIAVFIGSVLSFLVAPPATAAASAIAFLFSELADTIVYSALRRRGRPLAVIGSQVVGAAIDSSLFVYIAFGAFDLAAGNTIAKIYAGASVAAYLWAMQKRRKIA